MHAPAAGRRSCRSPNTHEPLYVTLFLIHPGRKVRLTDLSIRPANTNTLQGRQDAGGNALDLCETLKAQAAAANPEAPPIDCSSSAPPAPPPNPPPGVDGTGSPDAASGGEKVEEKNPYQPGKLGQWKGSKALKAYFGS